MDRRNHILRVLEKTSPAPLIPSVNADSACGYWYPPARADVPDRPGEEIRDLEALADQGLVERRFIDQVNLCPFCLIASLNVRETCPSCASANLQPAAGTRDRVCAACRKAVPHPVPSCVCLNCGQNFGLERVVARTLYAYRLTARGADALASGAPGGGKPAPSPAGDAAAPAAPAHGPGGRFSGALLDFRRPVFSLRFFEERLAQEILRARRYQRLLSVLLASPGDTRAYAAKFGDGASASLLEAVARVVTESLRDSDLAALRDNETLALLLPETGFDGAHRVADRICRRVYDLTPAAQTPKVTLSMGLVTLSAPPSDAPQMLEAAHRHLHAARKAGGNCVRPEAV